MADSEDAAASVVLLDAAANVENAARAVAAMAIAAAVHSDRLLNSRPHHTLIHLHAVPT